MGRCCSVGCTAVGQKSCTIAEVEPSLHFGLLDMVARHIGQLLSRSNHIITHSSQKICLHESKTGSLNSSWQMGQFPPDWSNK